MRNKAKPIIPPHIPEFFALQPRIRQQAFDIFSASSRAGDPLDLTRQKLASFLLDKLTPGALDKSLDRLIALFSSSDFPSSALDSSSPLMSVSSLDYKRAVELILADDNASPKTAALLLSFVVFFRKNFHPSGWVRLERKNVLFLAGLDSAPEPQKESLIRYLYSSYGLRMKPIGEKQCITCFCFDWLLDQPPVGSPDNPMISLGPLSPQNLCDIVNKIKKF